MKRNLMFLPRLLVARRRAIAIMKADPPAVVVSVGGYASLPAVLAARRLRIPVVVVTYDRTPGRSSRVTARFAAAVATAFPGSDLPRAHFTGAPVRRSVRTVDRGIGREAARRELGIPVDRFVISVIGGSLGSKVLNDAVDSFVGQSLDDEALAVFHVVGERFVTEPRTPESGERGMWYDFTGYEERMAAVYAASDMLIARGGAGTIADVATTGIPAILVPWSAAADDHQTANVRWLSDHGAAVLVAEERLPGGLIDAIGELRADPDALRRMSQRAHELGAPNRGMAIAALIDDVAGWSA